MFARVWRRVRVEGVRREEEGMVRLWICATLMRSKTVCDVNYTGQDAGVVGSKGLDRQDGIGTYSHRHSCN